tara:strand:+ start:140 stop:1417 length:1278 start_codon:yes stop_codon:yes gene_type:complete
MKNKFLKISFSFLAFLLMFSCSENDDYTNDSVVNATSPNLAVSLGFTNATTLIEQEASYPFSVSITEAQIVDVVVKLKQTDGTATAGEDFSMPNSVTIKKGSLSASGVITIHADELPEDEETVTIQIGLGNESNVSEVASEIVTFNIVNVTSGDVVIDLTWTSSATITDNQGNAIAAEDLADLEILVTNATIPTSQTFLSIDAVAGFESFIFLESFPDGEYFLVTRFFSAADYGGVFADLDLTLEFNQTGKINNEKVTIAAGLNTGNASCQSSIVAKLIKNGADYTIETVGLPNNAGIPADGTFVGDYTVATTSGGQFGPAFDGTVTVVDEGNGVRSFVGDWNGFGLDQTWEFEFNPICGTVTFVDNQDTGLGCGGPGIIHGASPNASVISDPTDDSSFTITYRENISGGCGGSPTDATITFTKI